MTKQDWTALAGDPLCTETIQEWAVSMLSQLGKMSDRRRDQTLREMTSEERDAISEVYRDGMTELFARLDWLETNIDTVLPSPVAA